MAAIATICNDQYVNFYAFCILEFQGLYNLSSTVVSIIINLAITLIINVFFRVGLERLMLVFVTSIDPIYNKQFLC